MRLTRGVIALAIITVVMITGSFALLSTYTPPVPPPLVPPTDEVDSVIVDGLELSVSIEFWQDFMRATPPQGPPFYLVLRVNVTNLGSSTVFGLNVQTVSVYFGGTLDLLHTFKIEPGLACCFDEFSVAPEHSGIFQFKSDRETNFSPDIEEGTVLYAQVELIWDTGQVVLTTPPSALGFTQ